VRPRALTLSYCESADGCHPQRCSLNVTPCVASRLLIVVEELVHPGTRDPQLKIQVRKSSLNDSEKISHQKGGGDASDVVQCRECTHTAGGGKKSIAAPLKRLVQVNRNTLTHIRSGTFFPGSVSYARV
jgi:hypothetical protein